MDSYKGMSSDNIKGLVLALSSSFFIGASFIVKKKGLKKAGASGVRAGKIPSIRHWVLRRGDFFFCFSSPDSIGDVVCRVPGLRSGVPMWIYLRIVHLWHFDAAAGTRFCITSGGFRVKLSGVLTGDFDLCVN